MVLTLSLITILSHFANAETSCTKGDDVQILVGYSNGFQNPSMVWTGSEFGLVFGAYYSSWNIYLARISPDGNVNQVQSLGRGYNPSITWNKDYNEYAVVWQDKEGGLQGVPGLFTNIHTIIKFARFDADGYKIGSTVDLTESPYSEYYFSDHSNIYPGVAWSGSEYAVLWGSYWVLGVLTVGNAKGLAGFARLDKDGTVLWIGDSGIDMNINDIYEEWGSTPTIIWTGATNPYTVFYQAETGSSGSGYIGVYGAEIGTEGNGVQKWSTDAWDEEPYAFFTGSEYHVFTRGSYFYKVNTNWNQLTDKNLLIGSSAHLSVAKAGSVYGIINQGYGNSLLTFNQLTADGEKVLADGIAMDVYNSYYKMSVLGWGDSAAVYGIIRKRPDNNVYFTMITCCTDNDGDGYAVEGGSCGAADCDDSNPHKLYVGAAETCDGFDNNCNGLVDEGCDDDNDDYCEAGMVVETPAPWTCPNGGNDCDDNNADIYPNAPELCDGADNQCEGEAGYGLIDNGCDDDNDDFCDGNMVFRELKDKVPVKINHYMDLDTYSLYGDKIVFSGYEASTGDMEVFMCTAGIDCKTGGIRISDGGGMPDIDQNHVVWRTQTYDYDLRLYTSGVVLYDTASGTSQELASFTDTRYVVYPKVGGSTVIWRFGTEIYMHDIASGTTTLVGTGSAADVYGNRIVWEQDSRIYYCTVGQNCGSGQTQISAGSNPRIYEDKVVWKYLNKIMMHDFSAGQAHVVNDDSSSKSNPYIYGNKIVWWASDAVSGHRIMMHSLGSDGIPSQDDTEMFVSKSPYVTGDIQMTPYVSDSIVMWQGYYIGYTCVAGGDCNDLDAAIHPNALELCDEKDNQCPGNLGYGVVDEGCCGNGILEVEKGEQCDDSNIASNDGCSNACITEYCGDGVVQKAEWTGHPIERCDDRNNIDGDGCSAACIVEPKIIYLHIPKIADVYKAQIGIIGANVQNLAVDVNDDGTNDYVNSGSFAKLVDLQTAVKNAVDACASMPYEDCHIPVKISSDSGSVTLTAVDVEYTNYYWDTGAKDGFGNYIYPDGRNYRARLTANDGSVISVSDASDNDFTICHSDIDGDLMCDIYDNCLNVPNPGQEDCDLDGIGDACDADCSSCEDVVCGSCVEPYNTMVIAQDTILCPGTYELADTEGDGVIRFNKGNIVLDCNGATLTGDGTGIGIYVFKPGVTIKNCNILNYGHAIYMETPTNTVHHNTLRGAITDIYYTAQASNNDLYLNHFYGTGVNRPTYNDYCDDVLKEGNFYDYSIPYANYAAEQGIGKGPPSPDDGNRDCGQAVITSPAAGRQIYENIVQIEWTRQSSIRPLTLTYILEYSSDNEATWHSIASLTAPETLAYDWDISGAALADGIHVIRLTPYDGTGYATINTTTIILNRKGDIRGKVECCDDAGQCEPVPFATVMAGEASAEAYGNGYYLLADVYMGTYDVVASREKRKSQRIPVIVEPQQTIAVDFDEVCPITIDCNPDCTVVGTEKQAYPICDPRCDRVNECRIFYNDYASCEYSYKGSRIEYYDASDGKNYYVTCCSGLPGEPAEISPEEEVEPKLDVEAENIATTTRIVNRDGDIWKMVVVTWD